MSSSCLRDRESYSNRPSHQYGSIGSSEMHLQDLEETGKAAETPSKQGRFGINIRWKPFPSVYKFRKFPRNAGVWLVFLMFYLYGVAEFSVSLILFFSLNVYHRLNPPQTIALYLTVRFVSYAMYPVMGFLADTYFGRYKVILAGLHISWLGSAIMSFSFAFLDPYLSSDVQRFAYGSDASWPDNQVAMLSLCYCIIWTGFTGIRVNLIPFGVDQLPEASGGELSSYFHWYYWFINAGYLTSSLTIPVLYKVTALSYTFLITNFSFSCIIVILFLFRHKLLIVPKIGNPFRQVYKVVRYAMKAKRPRYRSAFQIGQPLPSRIDLAMAIHGGRFSIEQVEDVKTFFRILLILLSFFGFFVIFSQLQSTYLMQGMRMKQPEGFYGKCPDAVVPLKSEVNRTVDCQFWKLPPSLWLAIANILPVLVLVPLVDRVVYPCLAGYSPTMLTRIAIGKVFLVMSIIVATGIEWYRIKALADQLNSEESLVINAIPFHTGSSTTLHVAPPVAIELIMPQYLLFAIADVLCNITAVEFIYAQSPAQMKGILLGLLFGTEGIAMGFAAAFIGLQNESSDFSFCSFFGNSNFFYKNVAKSTCKNQEPFHTCMDSPLCAYIIFCIVAVIFLISFIISALRYKFRRRDPDPYTPPWNYL